MNSDRLFQILSYSVVFAGFFSLWISGVFGVLGTLMFVAAMVGGWYLEGTKWQVSERLGTVLIVLSLPLFFVLLQAGFFSAANTESALPAILSRLIVSMSAIKIMQRKSDRDWIFLYVMSFFQVLLAAGLSISALYLASFIAYVFITVSAIIVFEIRKTRRAIEQKSPDFSAGREPSTFAPRRIPATAFVLIFFIVALASPLFFLLPRVGGAGYGGSLGGGVEASSGFADTVRLGGIGRIQQNDQVVMRVKIEDTDPEALPDIRWRGIALDTFDNQSWKKSKEGYPDRMGKGDRELVQVDGVRNRQALVWQTIYLEPINSPVMFVLPRAVGIQTSMPFLLRDEAGALSFISRGERISYRVLSEASAPDEPVLRRDNGLYAGGFHNYLQLPEKMDPRIARLASEITAGTSSRYDSARAIENYLQTQFGYTLEQKASGSEPLSDFLFNVREGHCEYFSTAMAVMLRTQGVATRVVNGFQRGVYNETAGVFVVRQRNAHSWVEVYFPGENTWVTFDPTPFAGQNLTGDSEGIAQKFNGYIEALEMFWIQYFVAYDSAEQRSLFSSVRRSVANYGKETSSYIDNVREQFLAWWRLVRGDSGFGRSIAAIGWGAAYVAVGVLVIGLFVWLYRWIVELTVWRRLWNRFFGKQKASIIEFYERMQTVLASKGFVREPHQTPLEFANAVGFTEAVSITEKYHRVRFGKADLSNAEAKDIDSWLRSLKETQE
ncbi:MAG TPA: DUF3488 and transglutaminase-like domain-containing protein [Pyrinomonadaceae bacterium]|nr:DUF3488 and transglutaminase-like domain-containing protein [Pyrinomonadaceae bacterium]